MRKIDPATAVGAETSNSMGLREDRLSWAFVTSSLFLIASIKQDMLTGVNWEVAISHLLRLVA
jgi:hypothetical protein